MVMIKAGERVQTVSGRKTSPAPSGASSHSDRAWHNALCRMDAWLLSEGIEEARSRNDEFVLFLFEGWDPKRLTTSDRDSLNDYLFGSVT